MSWFVLIIVLAGFSPSSQRVTGYASETTCLAEAAKVKKQRPVLDAFCVGTDRP